MLPERQELFPGLLESIHTYRIYSGTFYSKPNTTLTSILETTWKYEDNLKTEDDLKNEDGHKNEYTLKNEDKLKN